MALSAYALASIPVDRGTSPDITLSWREATYSAGVTPAALDTGIPQQSRTQASWSGHRTNDLVKRHTHLERSRREAPARLKSQ